jgi:hypothetical protein
MRVSALSCARVQTHRNVLYLTTITIPHYVYKLRSSLLCNIHTSYIYSIQYTVYSTITYTPNDRYKSHSSSSFNIRHSYAANPIQSPTLECPKHGMTYVNHTFSRYVIRPSYIPSPPYAPVLNKPILTAPVDLYESIGSSLQYPKLRHHSLVKIFSSSLCFQAVVTCLSCIMSNFTTCSRFS